jgi:DNA-binding response OmpR family regulator
LSALLSTFLLAAATPKQIDLFGVNHDLTSRLIEQCATEDTTVIGNMTIDSAAADRHRQRAGPIKTREFARLETLARRPGIVFSRERWITLAGPEDTDAIDRTFDVHVARLRRIFGRDTMNIRTVPGVGYGIDPPTDE